MHEDILKADLNTLFGGKDYHIVANIPYYLTTELMEKLLIVPGKDLVSVSLMVQKEAGERISALPGSKLYGPLSVLASFYGTPRIVRVVDRKCFTPAPDVDSCFITLPMRRSRISALSEADMRRFYRFVRIAFSMRRKTLLNNLLPSFPDRDKLETLFREAGLGPAIRAEQLDPECLYFLAQHLGRD